MRFLTSFLLFIVLFAFFTPSVLSTHRRSHSSSPHVKVHVSVDVDAPSSSHSSESSFDCSSHPTLHSCLTHHASQNNRFNATDDELSQYHEWLLQHRPTPSHLSDYLSSSSYHSYRFHHFIRNLRTVTRHNQDPNKSYHMDIMHDRADFVSRKVEMDEHEDPSVVDTLNTHPISGGDAWTQDFPNVVSEDEYKEFEQFIANNISPDNVQMAASSSSSLSSATASVGGGTWDWRTRNGVTPIRDQGQSNGCWAFATLGAVESAYLLKHKKVVSLAPQQLVDCAPRGMTMGFVNLFTDGTGPNEPANALDWLKENIAAKESSYPYKYKRGDCREGIQDGGALVKSYEGVGGEGHLWYNDNDDWLDLESLVMQGVVTAYIHVGDEISNYRGGVIRNCGGLSYKIPNHIIAVAGFGVDPSNNVPYWIIRNSWGSGWGEGGYFRIEKGVSSCGFGFKAVLPHII